jgi:hypothetical protein
MTSLLDIGDLTEEVKVGKSKITVWGATPEGFFYLLARFPMLKTLFTRGSVGLTMTDIDEVAPDCIARIIAVTTVDRSSCPTVKDWHKALDEMAAIAGKLSASHQANLFNAALHLTFPDGIGPFMRSMAALTTTINRISGQETVQATTSSKRSRSGFSSDSRGIRLGPAAPSASSRH